MEKKLQKNLFRILELNKKSLSLHPLSGTRPPAGWMTVKDRTMFSGSTVLIRIDAWLIFFGSLFSRNRKKFKKSFWKIWKERNKGIIFASAFASYGAVRKEEKKKSSLRYWKVWINSKCESLKSISTEWWLSERDNKLKVANGAFCPG